MNEGADTIKRWKGRWNTSVEDCPALLFHFNWHQKKKMACYSSD